MFSIFESSRAAVFSIFVLVSVGTLKSPTRRLTRKCKVVLVRSCSASAPVSPSISFAASMHIPAVTTRCGFPAMNFSLFHASSAPPAPTSVILRTWILSANGLEADGFSNLKPNFAISGVLVSSTSNQAGNLQNCIEMLFERSSCFISYTVYFPFTSTMRSPGRTAASGCSMFQSHIKPSSIKLLTIKTSSGRNAFLSHPSTLRSFRFAYANPNLSNASFFVKVTCQYVQPCSSRFGIGTSLGTGNGLVRGCGTF
mmetsp:Transcript_17157/g.27806  ORF Transcript_17157/g.27806 Transcript_17157/m.27806 type:complete len:255 (+) Transcript_17157:409-1173(+)